MQHDEVDSNHIWRGSKPKSHFRSTTLHTTMRPDPNSVEHVPSLVDTVDPQLLQSWLHLCIVSRATLLTPDVSTDEDLLDSGMSLLR